MSTPSNTLIDLEKKFWQSMIDEDTDTALELLSQPSFMVSGHGAMKFDHAAYRKMAEQGPMVVTSYSLSKIDVAFPNESTAVLTYHVKQEVAPRGQDAGKSKGQSKGKGDGKKVQEMNDTSTWVKQGESWKCVMHTETPASGERATN